MGEFILPIYRNDIFFLYWKSLDHDCFVTVLGLQIRSLSRYSSSFCCNPRSCRIRFKVSRLLGSSKNFTIRSFHFTMSLYSLRILRLQLSAALQPGRRLVSLCPAGGKFHLMKKVLELPVLLIDIHQ